MEKQEKSLKTDRYQIYIKKSEFHLFICMRDHMTPAGSRSQFSFDNHSATAMMYKMHSHSASIPAIFHKIDLIAIPNIIYLIVFCGPC